MGAVDRRGTAPRPILALFCRQRVEIEQDAPLGRLPAIAVEGRRAPQPARMRRVFPEVEDPRAASRDQWDVVRPVEDCSERVTIGRKALVAEARQGRRILRLDPGKRSLPVDLFELEVRVVVRRL